MRHHSSSPPSATRRAPGRGRFGAVAAGAVVVAASVAATQLSTSDHGRALPVASESTIVTVEPTRVLDTRYDIGLAGPFESRESRKLLLTGPVETYDEASGTTSTQEVIPAGATGALLNVTAVLPTV